MTFRDNCAAGDDEEDLEVREDRGGEAEVEADEGTEASGAAAAEAERLARRRFAERGEDRLFAEFERSARRALPRRSTYRFAPSRRGEAVDFRRTLKEAQRSGGEAVTLAMKARKRRQRPILLLIDVSGSMKNQTETTLRFAHALAGASDRMEAFTFGTRLTRVTRALQLRDRGRSISRIASLAADMDGGTRLGASLEAFRDTPRLRGFAAGSLAIVVSDGLERGSADRMVEAVRWLSAVAWRLYWLSPLAGDREYSLRTEALARSLPYLDGLGDGGSAEGLTECVLEAASLR